MATYTPDTSTRYCNWTYVRECDLPKGKKLLSCSRCNEVFYIDRESQTLHWKVHRKTCCPVASDDARIREEGGISSLRDCWDILHWILQDPMRRIKGRLFLYAFQRLKAYFKDIPGRCICVLSNDIVERLFAEHPAFLIAGLPDTIGGQHDDPSGG